ncbi:MAG: AgmX/PglI C-terminal domain-containing protein [Bdellovibrionaceae bacterium]|nr:AgmX/PglI C-terminal domain-containing protein [Pseudobdellovibrionaceae bacterium]
METQLVLRDNEGNTVRTFSWDRRPAHVIRRSDTRRLEVRNDLDVLEHKRIDFEDLGEISAELLSKDNKFPLGSLGHLKLVSDVGPVVSNVADSKENRRHWYITFGGVLLLFAGFMMLVRMAPKETPKLEEELQQHLVQIVKNIKRPEPVKLTQHTNIQQESVTKTVQQKSNSLKRMGALSVLGSMKNSQQRGGLDLGATQTTAGPGLGGTAGSGGVQTSLYAKGMVSAPLGAGGNVQGAGGYGTKGKGGGQAGYGKLTLTGSSGAMPIPLGQEASVARGLDKDMIAAVIQKNIGQVRFCYEQGLQSDAKLSGRVAIDFTIGGNGLVKAAGIENTTLNSKMVEDCLVMRLKTWKFPLPEGGVDVKVSYPFNLRRSGQG